MIKPGDRYDDALISPHIDEQVKKCRDYEWAMTKLAQVRVLALHPKL